MPNPTDKDVQLRRISERVWNITDTVYDDIESLMNAGFLKGKSARSISYDLIQYLNNPEQLTEADVEELLFEKKITEAEAAKINTSIRESAKLPRGVYRSQIKNAFRLARTETNIAYHKRDMENRERLPFVIGIEVHLSSQHPVTDICDSMDGKYPKDFVFTGWHPACICYTTSILAPKEQMKAFFQDKEPEFKYVQNIPKNAKNYIKDNSERFKKAKTTPFFITDNKIKL
jgi:hypothetical protein